MFVDERTIELSGGMGGDGIVHWHREKYLPKGGPDGGNGGAGGDVYLKAVRDIRVLGRYRQHEALSAEHGVQGKGALQTGKRGADLVVEVPIGSVVRNTFTDELFEMVQEGEMKLVATGGRGGLGNAHFKSSRNTTPSEATKGEAPQSYVFHIELNLIADIGIIGLPNAGKTTLLNTLTNADAKTASYPFTTLEPNLGVFHGRVCADIPGLIAHAAEGKGLGHTFLRHISRTGILLHLVAADSEDVASDYATIRNELGKYDPSLLQKKELVVLSKIDTRLEEEVSALLALLPEGTLPLTVLSDSSVASFGAALSSFLHTALQDEVVSSEASVL